MNPELTTRDLGTRGDERTRDVSPPAPQRGINGRPALEDHGTALQALTAAGRRSDRFRDAHPRSRRPALLLPLLIAGAAAVAVSAAIGPRYSAAVTFSLPRSGFVIDHDALRMELLDLSWRVLEQENGVDRASWRLDGSDDTMTVYLTSRNVERAAALLHAVTERFITTVHERISRLRDTPTDTERALTDYATALQKELADADAEVRAAMAAMPDMIPGTEHHDLRQQWRRVHTKYLTTRSTLSEAVTSLSRLRSEPEPTHGLVAADLRKKALHADSSLQNDLKELSVNLAELRLHLVTIGTQSVPHLDALARAVDAMRSTVAHAHHASAAPEPAKALARLGEQYARYEESFERFARSWRQTLEAIRAGNVDPMTAAELDQSQELTERLNEFIFAAATALTAMREAVNNLGQGTTDHARHHLLQSDLVRAFQTLQTAHHQFEFVAGRINGTGNFRLDAARRSAYGLRRRTLARIRDIDRGLEQQAAEQARLRHHDAVRNAESIVQRIRTATDQTVDELVELQARLNAAAEDSEAFHQALRLLDVAAARLEVTRHHLDESQARLTDLRARRLSTPIDTSDLLKADGVIVSPPHRTDQVRAGGIAFGITLLTAILGQRWTSPRRRPR